MRILFSSTRMAGHLNPLLPYAHAVLRRGHEVCVSAPESVGEVLQKAGLVHAPFGHPGDEALAVIWARERELSREEANGFAIREVFADVLPRAALPRLRETIRAWQPDLIVREAAEFASAVAADEAGIAHARVSVSNGHSFLHAAAPVDVLRVEAGLSPDNGASLRAAPAFTAFPASLEDSGGDGASRPQFRVRMPRDAVSPAVTPPTWAPKDGQTFVYITFGTIAGSSPKARAAYRAALDAVSTLPVQALLTTGPVMKAELLGTIPANVTVETWIPQDEVFPYATALLCHGGSGTMLGALAAGVPMVIAPLGADQPDNARRIKEVGAGIAVLDPDAASLRAALQSVLVDAGMRAIARRIADEIAAMPSIDDAVDALLAPLVAANVRVATGGE